MEHNLVFPKTLGPENARLLTTLVERGRAIFAIHDAQQVSGKNYPAKVALLRRLVIAGWVVRANASKYAVVPLSGGGEALPEANRILVGRDWVPLVPPLEAIIRETKRTISEILRWCLQRRSGSCVVLAPDGCALRPTMWPYSVR
jgi:hypothetical protein